jgi:hypothetical protein
MLPITHIKTASPAVKISSGHTTNGNAGGNGSESVSGRGLAHRKLSYPERVSLACDVALGQKQFVPSLGQLSSLFHVNVAALRAELKARAAANGNGHSDGVERLAEAWRDLSFAERLVALSTIGAVPNYVAD